MKYKITIEETIEYPEMETVYEAKDGKRYYSQYNDALGNKKEGVDYTKVQHRTGKMLERTKEAYTQYFESDDITDIIKAVNDIK